MIEQTIDKFREFGIKFGVRQAQHDLHDPEAPIQIASIQTLAALVLNPGWRLPDMDFLSIDTAHNTYE